MRLLCIIASRAFTSLNSDVFTTYSGFGARIFWISSCAALMRSSVIGWVEKTLASDAGLLLFQRLDLFEEVDERGGIVAGLIQILQAEVIGLALHSRARTSGSPSGSAKLGALPDAHSRPSRP